jgi:ferric-dicitrate binding protein FerR (iron transport regulator)
VWWYIRITCGAPSRRRGKKIFSCGAGALRLAAAYVVGLVILFADKKLTDLDQQSLIRTATGIKRRVSLQFDLY